MDHEYFRQHAKSMSIIHLQIEIVQRADDELQKAISARTLAQQDWSLLRDKDDNSYHNWNNEKVQNRRSKEENKQFGNLGKQISALNNRISGLRKNLKDEENKLIELVKNAGQLRNS